MATLWTALALAVTLAGPEDGAAAAPPPAGGLVRAVVDAGLVLETRPTAVESTYAPARGLGVGVDWAPAAGIGSLGGPAAWVRLGWARAEIDPANASRNYYGQGPIIGVGRGALDVWTLETGLRLRSGSGALRPYLDGGVGIAMLDKAETEVTFADYLTGAPTTYRIEGSRKFHPVSTVGVGLLWQAGSTAGIAIDVHLQIIRAPDPVHLVPLRLSLLFP
jgi:hypothetical protein